VNEQGRAPAVQIDGLRVEIAGIPIVHGVDFEVAVGDWLTVIGPNGAGKSTMLRAVGGLLPAGGSVALFGTALSGLTRRARAKLVATVVQSPVVPHGIAVVDYVLLGRVSYQSLFGRESRADLDAVWNSLDRLGLAGFAKRPMETLSGGERQRVFLARALAQGARLLLLDEPTTALDIGHQQEVLELVDELRRTDGLTVIATTHELSVAGEYADRLLLLVAGRVAALGPPEEVLTEALLAEHYGARVRVVAGEYGPVVVPVRAPGPATA
jgi:cobalamin transport system ATP-binding protein